MQTPILLLLLCFSAMVYSMPMPNEPAGPLFLLASIVTLAALLIWMRAAFAARIPILRRRRRRRRSGGGYPPDDRRWVVIDGSNVMFWQDETPSLSTVSAVVGEVRKAGLTPLVWFDANAGYKVGDRYMNPRDLSRAIGVSRKQVRVAPKGLPADPLLLEDAAKLGTGVVSNDKYRDWADSFPSVTQPGVLVRGRMMGGAAMLDWPAAGSAA
jgi:hypothetical protein